MDDVVRQRVRQCLARLALRLIAERFPRDRLARPMLCTGLLGAYTTFSTCAVQALLLSPETDDRSASLRAWQRAAGIAAVVLGLTAAGAVMDPSVSSFDVGLSGTTPSEEGA